MFGDPNDDVWKRFQLLNMARFWNKPIFCTHRPNWSPFLKFALHFRATFSKWKRKHVPKNWVWFELNRSGKSGFLMQITEKKLIFLHFFYSFLLFSQKFFTKWYTQIFFFLKYIFFCVQQAKDELSSWTIDKVTIFWKKSYFWKCPSRLV